MSVRIKEENPDCISIYFKRTTSQLEVFNFLARKGYTVKEWLWKFTDVTFPTGVTNHEVWTFTATKQGEKQCEDTLYKKVLEKELFKIFNEGFRF
jgi:hypothetical protein